MTLDIVLTDEVIDIHAVYVAQGGYLPLRAHAVLDFLAEKVDIGRS